MTSQTATPAAGQIHILNFAHQATSKLIEGFEPDQMCHQAESCANHALWVMGHMAYTDDYFLRKFGPNNDPQMPEAWDKIFGMDSSPTANADDYPSTDDVKTAFDDRRAALVNWFESLTEDQLRQPLDEDWQAYAPTVGDLAQFLAWHEAYHGGQLSVQRKALGLGRAFG